VSSVQIQIETTHNIEIGNLKELKIYELSETRELRTGEVKVYKRVRGVVDLESSDKKWYAIAEDDIKVLVGVLDIFAGVLSKIEFEVEITEEKYPELFKLLNEFEERNRDAWRIVRGVTVISYNFNEIMDLDFDRIRGYKVDEKKVIDEINRLWEEIVTKIDGYLKDRFMANNIEIYNIERWFGDEWAYYITVGSVDIEKKMTHRLEKREGKYVLRVIGDGTLQIVGTSITVV